MKPNHTEKRARILIVDDHPAVREALAIRIANLPNLRVYGWAINRKVFVEDV